MTINEFFMKTYEVDSTLKALNIKYQKKRPDIWCNDGFRMSVQAGSTMYCEPRITGNVFYKSAEIEGLSAEESLLEVYAKKISSARIIYPHVPCKIIDEIIKKHDGIDEEKTFNQESKEGNCLCTMCISTKTI